MQKIICAALIVFVIAGCNIVPKSVQYQKEEEKVVGSIDIANPIVNEVQVVLADLGYDTGNTDGRMGQKTREAIKTFQESIGLKNTGYIDMNTWRRIEDIMRANEKRDLDDSYKIEVRSAYSEEQEKKEASVTTKEIQIALKNAGFDPGTADGKLGPRTQQAVKEFQRAKGLKVDGKVGPKTWAELGRYLER
ncbi:MAG: peptidoglycan-binding protein [Candidatus Omnitrophica bacterium]|nr:peptidoglycan-binding protein [Candidatus Omnitrophota bacterium]